MAILLAGGAGYIGTHTAVEFLNAGYDVVIADDLYNSKKAAVQRVEKITGKKIPFYEIDVCDEEALRRVFAEQTIDTQRSTACPIRCLFWRRCPSEFAQTPTAGRNG